MSEIRQVFEDGQRGLRQVRRGQGNHKGCPPTPIGRHLSAPISAVLDVNGDFECNIADGDALSSAKVLGQPSYTGIM